MEVRCASCNKLFRVSDEKITGAGVKFSCTRCGETVKITREDLEQYKLSQDAFAALASYEPNPKPVNASATDAPPARGLMPEAADDSSVFDLSDPATAAASLPTQTEQEIPSLFAETGSPFDTVGAADPASQGEPSPFDMDFSKPAGDPAPPALEPRKAAGPAATPKPETKPVQPPVTAEAKPLSVPKPVSEPKKTEVKAAALQAPRPAVEKAEGKVSVAPPKPEVPAAKFSRDIPSEPVSAAATAVEEAPKAAARPSGSGKKIAILIILFLLVGAAGLGVAFYLQKPGQTAAPQPVKPLTLPEGLQIRNAAGMIDPEKGDLIITGVIENLTDTAKPAWYVVVDVYNAQGTVLTRGKLLSGKQIYTRRDLDILAKRGVNIQELMLKNMQEQGITIAPGSSVSFTVSIVEPPVEAASFNAVLQPFDPVQLFREMAEEQKQ